MASRTTPKPYMPTFLEARPRDTNAFGHGGIEDEWEDMERAYNSLSAGFQNRFPLENIATSCASRSLRDTTEVTMNWGARHDGWRCPTLMDLVRFQLRLGYKRWMPTFS